MACSCLTFEPTRNFGLVRGLYTMPQVWPWIGDDFAGERETFQVNEDPRIVYLLALEDVWRVGLLTFLPQNTVCWEGHIILFPWRKSRGHVILRGALDWMFEHTTAQRITGAVPAYNRLTMNLVRRAGMVQYGENPRSFMKNGHLENQVLFGSSKEA